MVAVMTIPNLIVNATGIKHRNQFKKVLSTMNQSVRMSMAKYDFDYSSIEKFCRFGYEIEGENTFCNMLNGTLSGFSVQEHDNEKRIELETKQIDTFSYLDGDWGDSYTIYLADGSTLLIQNFFASGPCTLNIGESLSAKLSDPDFNSNCLIFIDVNGVSKPNKEVRCSDGVVTNFEINEPCIVKNKDVTDIFPIVVHDTTVEPASNAAKYILNTTK